MKKKRGSVEEAGVGLIIGIIFALVFGAIIFNFFFNQPDVINQFNELITEIEEAKVGEEQTFLFDMPENYAIVGFNRAENFKGDCYGLELGKIEKPTSRTDCNTNKENCLCICPLEIKSNFYSTDHALIDCSKNSKCVPFKEELKGTPSCKAAPIILGVKYGRARQAESIHFKKKIQENEEILLIGDITQEKELDDGKEEGNNKKIEENSEEPIEDTPKTEDPFKE